MTNEQRTEALIEKYGFIFEVIPKIEITELIENEILNFQPGSSEYVRALCGYLYCIGDISDAQIIERAKYEINMDVGCMVDGEWIDSLKNGGVGSAYLRPREEIIQSFIEYYREFEANDE
jgi:hypothetical protein